MSANQTPWPGATDDRPATTAHAGRMPKLGAASATLGGFTVTGKGRGATINTSAATASVAGSLLAADKAKLDTLGSGAGIFYGVRARNSAAIGLVSGANTALAYNTNTFSQVNDASTPHSTAINPSRFTATKAGWWAIVAHAEFAPAVGGTIRRLGILMNGATFLGFASSAPTGAANSTHLTLIDAYKFAANDYVEVTALQDSGGGLNVNTGAEHSPAVTWIFLGA